MVDDTVGENLQGPDATQLWAYPLSVQPSILLPL